MLEEISESVKTYYKKRIVGFLYYGSRAFNKSSWSKDPDYDLVLVLKSRHNGDVAKLSEIVKTYNMNLDVILVYEKEITGKGINNFQFGGHGSFVILYLSEAMTLIGKNPFAEVKDLVDLEAVNLSILRNIHHYFWRLEHKYIHECHDQELINYFIKYIERICLDILIVTKQISFSEHNFLSKGSLHEKILNSSGCFSLRTKRAIKTILYKKQDYSIDDLVRLKASLLKDFTKIETVMYLNKY